MSRENVELVHSIYADWERGDFGSAEWAHPEIEFVGFDGPEPDLRTGAAGMSANWGSTLAAWEELRAVPEEYRELDDERVLVVHRWRGRGKTSGLDIGQIVAKAACVFHVRGGKVTKLVCYWDAERALADLGLAPETGSGGT